jgi:hypothetical protein
MEKGPEEIAEKQNKAQVKKQKSKPRQWTVWFGKPDHPASPGSGQKRMSRTTTPGIAPAPC